MQNSVLRSRMTFVCRSQTSPIFFAFKTVTLAPELQVSIVPNLHLWFCAFTTATLWPQLIVSMCPRPLLSFCACKTAWLASESLVSIGPSPHLRIEHAKQRLLDRNYKPLWVSDFACWLSECTTACLEPEWRLSISPSLHLWFCAFTTAIKHQNY